MSAHFPIDLRWDSVEISDDEKNDAVNRIERALARRKRTPQVTSEVEETSDANSQDPDRALER